MGRGEWYESMIARRIATGEDVAAPARYVIGLAPKSVLDVGCGSGHLARELFDHGVEVIGVDIDPEMIETARILAPRIEWIRADIGSLDIGRTFDAVMVVGNVLNFVAAQRIPEAVRRVCLHVKTGGYLATSFTRQGAIALEDYDRICNEQQLKVLHLWSDWIGTEFTGQESDIVVIHRRAG